MKRLSVLTLVLLLLLTSTAFAIDLSRFEQAEGVDVDCDPANPTAYSVLAGFAEKGNWAQPGGHMLIRYKNMGKSEELPLILVSFTTSGFKAENMTVRTAAHQYAVVCTDLAAAGLSAIDSESSVLVTSDSLAMLQDAADSAYVRITLWSGDPAGGESFTLSGADRAMLKLFLDEYTAEVAPMLDESANLVKVYDRLTPAVTAGDAEDLSGVLAEILGAEYDVLEQGASGDGVAALQQALADLGYAPGTADGVYGRRTAAAVKAFQADSGLSATGVADAETQAELFLAVRLNDVE